MLTLCSKLADLNEFVHCRRTVSFLISIVETWLNNLILDGCINISGYAMARYDRPTLGGGTLFLCQGNHHIFAYKCFTFGSVQVLYVDIKCAHCHFLTH